MLKIGLNSASLSNKAYLGSTLIYNGIFSSVISWGDEFEYSGVPDSSKWGYDIGMGHFGWGNNELQYDTDRIDNAVVNDGKLKIIAKQESYSGAAYTSARLKTFDKKLFQYGRFEFKAKFPNTAGLWNAIWLFGHTYKPYFLDTWYSAGELDVAELAGSRPTIVQQSVHTETYHYGQNFQTELVVVPNVATIFNKYRIDWTPEYIRWFVNDVQTFEFLNDGTGNNGYPFEKYFYLLLALNIGGDFVGGTVNNAALPATMEIEYVRYYELLGGFNDPLPDELENAPTITPTSQSKAYAAYAEFNVVGKPAGKSVNWYASGNFQYTGDTFPIPPNLAPVGTYIFTAVLVDDITGIHSKPTEVILTVTA